MGAQDPDLGDTRRNRRRIMQASLVMAAAVERQIMAERMMLSQICRTVARHTSRNRPDEIGMGAAPNCLRRTPGSQHTCHRAPTRAAGPFCCQAAQQFAIFLPPDSGAENCPRALFSGSTLRAASGRNSGGRRPVPEGHPRRFWQAPTLSNKS